MGQGPQCCAPEQSFLGNQDVSDERCCQSGRCADASIVVMQDDGKACRSAFATNKALQKSRTATCLESDHIESLENSIDQELRDRLFAPDFQEQCRAAFQVADVDGSGYLEQSTENLAIAVAVQAVLPDEFFDRLDGKRAESCAMAFDKDWDGRLTLDEFSRFVRWAAIMKARGFLDGQAPFEIVGSGTGDRLLVVSEYMDDVGSLRDAVKDSVDLAIYNPSGIACGEFAEQIVAATRVRAQEGREPYRSVALANHGPDETGIWRPFAGKWLDLTRRKERKKLLPVFQALAALLPTSDGRLDILACDLASVPGGMAFVKKLEKVTGRTVCAASGATGNASHGGSWTMGVGHVNVAPDYFDEEKLKHFEKLMRCHIAPPATRNHHRRGGHHEQHSGVADMAKEHVDSSDGTTDSEELDRRATESRAAGLFCDVKGGAEPGQTVTVVEKFDSDSSSPVPLPAGSKGQIMTVDHNGNAKVKFEGIHQRQLVLRENLPKLGISKAKTAGRKISEDEAILRAAPVHHAR